MAFKFGSMSARLSLGIRGTEGNSFQIGVSECLLPISDDIAHLGRGTSMRVAHEIARDGDGSVGTGLSPLLRTYRRWELPGKTRPIQEALVVISAPESNDGKLGIFDHSPDQRYASRKGGRNAATPYLKGGK